MSNVEKKHVLCKVCNEVKPAIFDGYRADGTNKVWIDEFGGEFNGKICPPCNVKRVRSAMGKMRKERKLKDSNGK
jgi:hypothetical protein